MKPTKTDGRGDTPGVTNRTGHDTTTTQASKTRLQTLDELDQRTHAARKARFLVSAIEADLGGGDNLSTAQRELVKRAALLGAIVEDHEVRWLQQQGADLSLYGTLVDRQRRILETLGLGRVARDVSAGRHADHTDILLERLEAQP